MSTGFRNNTFFHKGKCSLLSTQPELYITLHTLGSAPTLSPILDVGYVLIPKDRMENSASKVLKLAFL